MPLDTSIPMQIAQVPQTQALNPMALYQMMQERQAGALRNQLVQQEMLKNNLAMQYAAEDRRLAAAARAQAAQKAAEDRANVAYLSNAIRGGFKPAKEAVMGPGTIQGSTPSSFDEGAVLNALYAKGNPALLTAYSNMQEQFGKQREAEAKAAGQGLTNVKTQTETQGLKIKNVTDQLTQLNAGLERASTPQEIAALFNGSADAIRATGKTPDMSIAAFNQLAGQIGFDAAKQQVAQGVTAVQKHLSDSIKTLESPQGVMEYMPGTGEARPITVGGQPVMPVDRRSVTNIDMKGEGAFAGELGKLEAADVIKSRGVAEDARSVIDTINTGRTLLDKGVFSGFGANFKLNFAKAAKELGASGFDGKVENTEAYASNMAQNVGKLIKQFGAGTGLSDADRKYAEQMAGGQISLDEKSMRKILEISDRAARNVILAHNKRVEGIPSKTGLTVELPPAAPVSTGGVSVTTPSGKVFSFPTPEAAAQFKKAAGIP